VDTSQQAWGLLSWVRGHTGLIGALLAFGAIVMSVAGMFWPRLADGWGRAKRAWHAPDDQSSHTGPRVSARGTPSRWGDEPLVYGWEMALFAGAAYWFLHAKVDRLWPMAGLTMPALLMMAAGLAATDARAGTLWPIERVVASGVPAGSSEPAAGFPVFHGDLRPPGRLSQRSRHADRSRRGSGSCQDGLSSLCSRG
jgi:hypothetical protein